MKRLDIVGISGCATLVRFRAHNNEKLKSHKHCGELLRGKSRAPSSKKKTNHYNDSELCSCVCCSNTFNRPKSGILQGFIEYALMYIYIDGDVQKG